MKKTSYSTVVISAVLLAGCATTTVSSDYNRTVDFSKFKTYSWAGDQKSTDDPRFDDPDLRAMIKQSIETGLQAKGLQKITAGQPDLLLKYYITVEKKKDFIGDYYPPTFDSRTGVVNMPTVGARNMATFQYEDGTFVLDILDPGSGAILWRGSLNGMVDPGATLEKRKARAPGAVAKVLAKFPPGNVAGT